MKRIMIFGGGYVGGSLSLLFAKKNKVFVIDKDENKIKNINEGIPILNEPDMESLIKLTKKNLKADRDFLNYIDGINYVILCLPTNYCHIKGQFDTSVIESVIESLNVINFSNPIIIKSTVPVGFTSKMNDLYPEMKIIFSPEFLREGSSLSDNLFPSRVVVGGINTSLNLKEVGNFLTSISKNNPKIFFMSSSEAESVKLFSNAYLATRVSFFNELDSFCIDRNLETKSIIDAVSADTRIGNGYNNPSFGYGGYCLPKDTKQLLSSFGNVHHDIFSAIIKSNASRKEFLANLIKRKKPSLVGIYRLLMKSGSNNFRDSAIFGIIEFLNSAKVPYVVYEPTYTSQDDFKIESNIKKFKNESEIIIANRLSDELEDVKFKVFSRDIYNEN